MFFPRVHNDGIESAMKGLIRTLYQQYRKALPNEDDAAAIVMTVVVN